MLAELILSLMLSLGPMPGQSTYSVVEVPEGTPAPCDDTGDLMCKWPWQDRSGRWGRRGSWVRYEQFDEGLIRYWDIAQAIAKASDGDARLARYLITITRHESGWRRDVHTGLNHTVTLPEAARLEDGGRSWCLGQIMLGRTGMARVKDTEWLAHNLVGLGPEATDRCLTTVAKNARKSQRICRATPWDTSCVFRAYGGVASKTDPRIQARVNTFARMPKKAAQLPFFVRAELNLPMARPGDAATQIRP